MKSKLGDLRGIKAVQAMPVNEFYLLVYLTLFGNKTLKKPQ